MGLIEGEKRIGGLTLLLADHHPIENHGEELVSTDAEILGLFVEPVDLLQGNCRAEHSSFHLDPISKAYGEGYQNSGGGVR